MALGIRAAFLAGEMNSVPKRILISVGVLVLVLLGVNLYLWPNQALQQSPTSFGVMREGYKAAFDLLSEMHFPVTRSYRRAKLTPTDQVLWFVSPSFLIADKPGASDEAHQVVEWASRGGTAVVFGGPDSTWKVLGLARDTTAGKERPLIEGDVAHLPRWLDVSELLHFTATEAPSQDKQANADGRERVRLTADKEPFALEVPVGTNHGRLIAIADDRFIRNENLANGDASLLLVDLVRAFGIPVFDEHSHGLVPPSSLIYAVLDSRAVVPLSIGLLVAMLWIFSQRVWPPRSVAEDSGLPAPSIASFVESLSILYSRAGDPAAVFRAYRTGFLRRLRRQIGLRADYPEDLLLERIARDRSLPEETRHWLLEREAPSDQRRLVIAVRAIESYSRLSDENRAR
jgi:hypothetical protein